MEAQEGDNFKKMIDDLGAEFSPEESVKNLKSTLSLLSKMKDTIKSELAAGNIDNAQKIKDLLSKHVPIEETNKMMEKLSKLYDRQR